MIIANAGLSCNYLYLIYNDNSLLDVHKKNKQTLSYVLLTIIAGIMIFMQVGGCMMMRRVYISFNQSLESYIDYLLGFQETPRSKLAKKYLSPLEVLEEETASMINESVRGSNSTFIQKLRMVSQRQG